MKFRKKPVVIEAVQLTWDTWPEIYKFVPEPWFVRGVFLGEQDQPAAEGVVTERLGLLMQTLESEQFLAVEGDWIIKGVKGEFYPCKPDIFAATYEEVAL